MTLKIKITLADRVETALDNFDERVERDSPEYPTYAALHEKARHGRSITLTTPDELRVVYDELVSGVDVCDEALGGYAEGWEEEREYTLERANLKRSADRLARVMVDADIPFNDAERDEHG